MSSNQPPKIKVLIVDDHDLTRYSLNLLLGQQENIELVGLAANGQEAIEMAKAQVPDVVILDLQMPVMNGLTAATFIKSVAPHLQILAHSSVEDPQIEVMSQTAPIAAFSAKDLPTQELLKLVNELGKRAIAIKQDLASTKERAN